MSSLLVTIIGYFYFLNKFSPPENYLTVTNHANNISYVMVNNSNNSHSAILLPVKLDGINFTFYMQLDFGSPTTIFYEKAINSIQTKYPNIPSSINSAQEIKLSFYINELSITSDKFRLINYGSDVNFDNENLHNIIGTIGTDLLEKRPIVLDFKKGICSFPYQIDQVGLLDFKFKNRRILLPAKMENKELYLMYDSGTSGYELITDKETWSRIKLPNSKVSKEYGNSWGKKLEINTSPTNLIIKIGGIDLSLTEITYIDGVSKVQELLMRSTGLDGMIGNKLFLNNKIILDCKNKKFRLY